MDPRADLYKCRRRPWLATLLSLFMPGLGQVYSGKLFVGLVLVVACTLIPAMLIWSISALCAVLSGFYWFWFCTVLVIVVLHPLIYISAIIHAWRSARKAPLDYKLKEYNNLLLYLFLLFVVPLACERIIYSIKDNYVQGYRIPTFSNYPNILVGDIILGNKKVDFEKLCRGDFIVFTNPYNDKEDFCKRIIATEGDSIEIKKGRVYLNDKQLTQEVISENVVLPSTFDYKVEQTTADICYEHIDLTKYKIATKCSQGTILSQMDFPKKTVPKDGYFVLGDNRLQSQDSRHFGFIRSTSVKAKLEYLYLPGDLTFSRVGKLDKN